MSRIKEVKLRTKDERLIVGTRGVIFQQAMREVSEMSKDEEVSIYPPSFSGKPLENEKTRLQKTSKSLSEGPLSRPEAVGMRVLSYESHALSSSFGISFETSAHINDMLELPDDAWQHDALSGIAEFGNYLAMSTGVRNQIRLGIRKPQTVESVQDRLELHRWERFENPLREDGLQIGKKTAFAAEAMVVKRAHENLRKNPGAAKNIGEVKARIKGRKHGAELARRLYLEAKDKASQLLGED